MVSGGGFAKGREIRLIALVFIVDDSSWLQEAPLDIEALPIHGATHFRACVRGVLLRQPLTQYRSTPAVPSLPAARRCKRSGRSRLQRWVKHAVACQLDTPQVATIEREESIYGLFDMSTGSVETLSECDNSDPAAEVPMVDTPRSPHGMRRNGGNDGGGEPSRIHEEYHSETLSSQQREELHHINMEALHTPVVGETSEARALEAVRLDTLAKRTRLENLQGSLDERARQQIPKSSR